MNDHQLLGAYVLGDEQAFETLVQKYFRMVYAVATRQTGDSHLAEDIAQCVFLILSRKARGLSPKASVAGWLLRTTRFVCHDAIKMRRRRNQNEQKLTLDLERQVLESKPDQSLLELLLDEALQALRPDEQAGIVARYFEGKDFQEIAEMFAISEEAARKRTSRCLAKLQSFIAKRGANVSLQILPGLLMSQAVQEAANRALQSTLDAMQAIWHGQLAASNAVGLANRVERLRWRFLAKLSLNVALLALFVFLGLWAVFVWNAPVSSRLEKLGRAWGALDIRVAQHRQFLVQTDPNTPNFQARVQAELEAISRQSSRIVRDLDPLLKPPGDRAYLAQFLTAELCDTLNLDSSKKTEVLSYIENRLAQGPTFRDAMKTLAESTQSETAEIKAMLSPEQQQRFDQIYGADGVLLFSYAKAVALGRIGA